MKKYRLEHILYNIFVQIIFILLAATIIFSLYYLVANSFKSPNEFSSNQFAFPKSFDLENFKYIWNEGGIKNSFKNSLFICFLSTLICILVAVLTGFTFSFKRFTGKRTLSYLILTTMYVSPMALVVPLFIQMSRLKLTNSYIGIIIIYIGLNLAYSIYLVSTYFKNIPEEVIEAAVIDGCNNFGLLGRIYIPLSLSGLLVLFIIDFSTMWNDLLFSFIFLQDEKYQTIMIAIAKYQGKYGTGNMTYIISALLIATLPILVLYLITQRYFKRGVLMGSIK